MRSFDHARLLAWAALLAAVMTATGNATATANPDTFEVDLLFPRNATYTPQTLMPIVFAMQNPTLASPLEATILWELWEGNNETSPGSITDGVLELALLDPSLGDPLLVTRFVNTVAYPDGVWTLRWTLHIFNCTYPAYSNKTVVENESIALSNATTFTTSGSGQAPDLVAATSADVCGTTVGYAFNVASFGDVCGAPGAVLGPSPSTNPCAATINATAASSISAAATAWACSPLSPPHPNFTCPTSTSKPSTSSKSHIAAASTLFTLLATLTILIHLG